MIDKKKCLGCDQIVYGKKKNDMWCWITALSISKMKKCPKDSIKDEKTEENDSVSDFNDHDSK